MGERHTISTLVILTYVYKKKLSGVVKLSRSKRNTKIFLNFPFYFFCALRLLECQFVTVRRARRRFTSEVVMLIVIFFNLAEPSDQGKVMQDPSRRNPNRLQYPQMYKIKDDTSEQQLR